MIHAHVVVEENTNSAAEEQCNCQINKRKEVSLVVELDQFKYTLGTYDKPLTEVGDSL